jgi:hypothetical protein
VENQAEAWRSPEREVKPQTTSSEAKFAAAKPPETHAASRSVAQKRPPSSVLVASPLVASRRTGAPGRLSCKGALQLIFNGAVLVTSPDCARRPERRIPRASQTFAPRVRNADGGRRAVRRGHAIRSVDFRGRTFAGRFSIISTRRRARPAGSSVFQLSARRWASSSVGPDRSSVATAQFLRARGQ